MRKLIYLLALAITLSVSLSSCSSSDDDGNLEDLALQSNGTIEINGKKYPIAKNIEMVGEVRGDVVVFYVTVIETRGSEKILRYHCFSFTNENGPEANMDLTNKNLRFNPDDDWDYADDSYEDNPLFIEFDYHSGDAKITSINKEEGKIYVVFDNLVMKYKNKTYKINGSVTSPFDFYQEN